MNPDKKLTVIGVLGAIASAVGDYITNNGTITVRGAVTAVVFAVLGIFGAGEKKQ